MENMTLLRQFLHTGDCTPEAVGARLRMARLILDGKPSQADIAGLLGVTPGNWHHVERGAQYPKPHHVEKLFQTFGLDHNFVYRGEPSGLPLEMALRLLSAGKADARG